MLMMCGIGGKDNGKRKGNAKSVAGEDCRISFSEDGLIIRLNNTDFEDFYHEAELNHIFSLNPVLKFENFRPIDVYKSLCKYVLSIIPNELVPNFKPTISWLLGKHTLDSLPNVVTTITQLTNHPIVGYFIRQNETCSPYSVGFFRFAMLTYVFIIPGANDDYSYPNDNWLLEFANRLHRGNSTWYSKDLSSSKKMTPKFPIEITNVNLGRNCFLGSKDQFNIS